MSAVGQVPSYQNQCALLGIKPNSRLARNAAALEEQKRLDFSLNYIGGGGLQAATAAIAANHQLETLILSGNGLSNESVVFFCREIKTHPSLTLLDLSNNPISLPAGLALIELMKTNTTLQDIKLNDTLIDDAVQAKIRRLLNLSRMRRDRLENKPPTTTTTTPFQKAVAEFRAKAGYQGKAAKNARLAASSLTVDIEEQLAAMNLRVPQRGPDGWAVLQLYISSVPLAFHTELAMIHEKIIPQLNAQFATRKVHIIPFSMHHGVPPLAKARAKTQPPRTAVLVDYHGAIIKSAPLFVQLVGDKIGLNEFTPSAVPSPTPASSPQRAAADKPGGSSAALTGHHKGASSGNIPHLTATGRRIMEREFELAGTEHSVRLVFLRAPATSLHVPAALVSGVSDDPHLTLPDPLTKSVTIAVAKAQGVPLSRGLTAFDPDVAARQWAQHKAFVARLESEISPAFLTRYRASFAGVDDIGQITMTELEGFQSALLRQLTAVLEYMFPITQSMESAAGSTILLSKWAPSAALNDAVIKAFLQQATASIVGRKNISGKLDLYTVTPPSRNAVLVTCTPGSGATSTLAAYALRGQQKATYVLAMHFATNPWLQDEPSDLRTVLLNIAKQLSKDKTLPSHVLAEVDIAKIISFFNTSLAEASGDAGEVKTIIIALDGLDDIDKAIYPCRSLRVSDTGADAWDPPAQVVTIQKPLPAVTHRPVDTFEWIPVCLSRNVRVVVTAQKGSDAHQTMALRGHDSCDVMTLGDIGVSDVETIVLREAESIGVQLREDEVAAIRGKTDSNIPEYLVFIIDHLRQREETTLYTTRLTALTQLPPTVEGMCHALLDALEADIGLATARTIISLLLASRWGLLELELRILLRLQKQQTIDAGAHAHAIDASTHPMQLLSGEVFQQILRRLRPVLTPYTEVLSRTQMPLNGLHLIVHIRSRTFRSVATARYMTRDVMLSAHHQLAHHYHRLLSVTGPLETRAVREFPYHVVAGEMWTLLDTSVATLDFVMRTYLHRLGYQTLRELMRAYNTLDDARSAREENAAKASSTKNASTIPAEIGASMSKDTIAALMLKLKEYIYFIRDHSVNLVQYPHMVRQIAMTSPPGSSIQADAKEFFLQMEQYPHFVVLNRSRAKLHRDKINSVAFAPTGLRIASCSDDRTIRISNLTADPLILISQCISKVVSLCYSQTSRYLAASCEDRSMIVVDATNGAVVSRPVGHMSSVKAIALSSRGRYLFSGGEDKLLKVWSTETGNELFSVSHVPFSHHTSPYGAVSLILVNPIDEDVFYTVCDTKLIGWKVKSSAVDDAVQQFCIAGHATLPLATCHIAGEGAHAVTCARDLVAPERYANRTEDNIKLWSLTSGRCLATLSLGVRGNVPGHIFTVLSPDEKKLAAATFDGGLDLFQIDWRSLAPSNEEGSVPVILTPYRRLSAFKEHPTPQLLAAAFSFDSYYVAAIGNMRQLKVWSTSDSTHTDSDSKAAPTMSGSLLTALSASDHTLAEFLMDQPATCMVWTANPTEEGGELAVGDIVGKLYSLKLKR